jgi:hypothetical protein
MVKVSLASVNEPELVCPICMDVLKDHARVVACGHLFDFQCIKSWILVCDKEYRALACPCCRIKMKAIGRVDSKGYRFTTPVASLIRETDDVESLEDPANERSESVIAEERNRVEYEEYQSSMRAAREASEQQYIMDEQRRQCLEERKQLSFWTPRCTIS